MCSSLVSITCGVRSWEASGGCCWNPSTLHRQELCHNFSCFTAHHKQGGGSVGAVSELPSLAFRFTVKSVTIFWEHLVREGGVVNTTNSRCSGRWLQIRREGEGPSQERAGSPATVSKGSVLWSVCGLYVCAAISDGYHSNTCVLWYTFCLVKYKHTEVLGSAFPKKSLWSSRLPAHTPPALPVDPLSLVLALCLILHDAK